MVVSTAKWQGSTDVAVKIQNVNCVSAAAYLDEAQILKTLQHPNILELRGVCSEVEPCYLLMEYMPLGQLSRYLRERGTMLVLSQLIHIGAQVFLIQLIKKKKFLTLWFFYLLLLLVITCHFSFHQS